MMNTNSNKNQPNIVVVGSINCDQTAYLKNFPKINETVFANNSQLSLGGKGLNQATAAARLGGKVTMISCVGNDVFGDLAKTYLEENQINQEYIKVSDDIGTGTATIYVTDSGENMIAVTAGANACLSPEYIREHADVIRAADILIVQLELPLNTVKEALTIAADANVFTVLNPAPASDKIIDLLELSAVITPNETEVEILTGIYPDNESTAKLAVVELKKMGAKIVIITMGDKGYYLSTGKTDTFVPSLPVIAVDPTGAGDVFNGAFSTAIANGLKIENCAQFASAAAALSVTKKTAQDAAPTRQQTEDFLKLNKIEIV